MKPKIQFGLLIIFVFNVILNLLPGSWFRCLLLRLIRCKVGNGVGMHSWTRFTWPGRFSIGDDSTVNFDCFLDTRGSISIGAHTMIGHRCSIYTASHDINDVNFAGVKKSVEIGDYVVVFPHSLIMPGVKIGKGAVIMPGSVVTRDVGEYQVVGGVPARFVKERSQILDYKLAHQYLFIDS